ncbi:MAG: RsmD family RNA methyltransferase [Planctomycetes bacterium]|nr:RsmD family RNA methyltransferase [Planctomycetota bacterium]
MSLRVISGQFGGRKLETVPGYGTRPLLGQVREALFNILGEDVDGALVWDLFAGTGATGIEALSRGARRVIFIEKNSRALRVLSGNLGVLDPDHELDFEIQRGNAWSGPKSGQLRDEGEDRDEDRDENDDSENDDSENDDSEDRPRSDRDTGDPDDAPDLIFLDPPYADVREDPTLSVARAFALYRRLTPGGKLIFHFPDGVLDEDDFASFERLDLRSWGQAAVAILTR